MKKTEVENKTYDILASFLGESFLRNGDRSLESEWDSLKHMQIIFALEEQFSITFTEDEISSLNSVKDITKVIIEKYGP